MTTPARDNPPTSWPPPSVAGLFRCRRYQRTLSESYRGKIWRAEYHDCFSSSKDGTLLPKHRRDNEASIWTWNSRRLNSKAGWRAHQNAPPLSLAHESAANYTHRFRTTLATPVRYVPCLLRGLGSRQ